jgi:hypothetical protein
MTQKKYATRPDSLKIGPHWYTVEWLTKDEWDSSNLPADIDGATQSDRCRIALLLGDNRPESHYQHVLVHEVQHAVWHGCGLTLTAKWNEGSDDDVEERVIVQTSMLLLQVLQDNPHLVKYLQAEGHVRR